MNIDYPVIFQEISERSGIQNTSYMYKNNIPSDRYDYINDAVSANTGYYDFIIDAYQDAIYTHNKPLYFAKYFIDVEHNLFEPSMWNKRALDVSYIAYPYYKTNKIDFIKGKIGPVENHLPTIGNRHNYEIGLSLSGAYTMYTSIVTRVGSDGSDNLPKTGIYKYIDKSCETLQNTINDISTKVGHDQDLPNNIQATGLFKMVREMIVKDPSLQQLWDDYYYQAPEAIKYTASLSTDKYLIGESISKVTAKLIISNYHLNLSKVLLGNRNILTNKPENWDNLFTANGDIITYYNFSLNTNTSDISIPLLIETNFKDSKNNGPTNVHTNMTIRVIKPQFITSNINLFDTIEKCNNSNILDANNIKTYGRVDNITRLNINLPDDGNEHYIYIISTHNIASDKTLIFELGTSPLGTGGLINIGLVQLTLTGLGLTPSNNISPITYYVYRSENPLTGNWTVIV